MPALNLKAMFEVDVGSPIGQCRAAPVNLGPGAPPAFLAVYAADFDVDPYIEMFFFPSDTLKLILFDDTGQVLWQRDLGRGVVPGMWFCPVFPFDLDGDGVDEIYFVNNIDPQHPLGVSNYRLEALNAHTGNTIGQWPWPAENINQKLSHVFRNFIIGGHVKNDPVLITAQGTYGDMYLQAWRPDMSRRWTYHIAADTAGARGSHMLSIVDLDDDHIDELMWGERCIELDTGGERFCADEDSYRGHSDVVQPMRDPESGKWFVYTIRESDAAVSPRVAMFDARGERVWGAVEEGHMDMGWTARLGDDMAMVASAIRIGHKVCGPDGRYHQEMTEFTFDALSGRPIDLGFSTYRSMPVDLNGDGYHELVRGRAGGNGEVLDRHGQVIGNIGTPVAMAGKYLDHPGEQMLAYDPSGILTMWADAHATDTEVARQRYAHPFYRHNIKASSTGWNLGLLGGI